MCMQVNYLKKNPHFFTDPGFPKSQWQPPPPSPTSQGMLITINCYFKCIVPTFTTIQFNIVLKSHLLNMIFV